MGVFSILNTDVQYLVQDSSATTLNKIKAAVNRAYRSVAQAIPWPSLREEADFTCQANGLLVLPQYVAQVLDLYDDGNTRRIEPDASLRRSYASTYTTTGSPYRWSYDGTQAVWQQPSAASVISIDPDEATDTGTTVKITGLVTPTLGSTVGYIRRENDIVTAGTAAVAGTVSFVKILAVSKTAASAADIGILASTTLLGVLEKEEYTTSYQRVRLHYRPASGTTIRVVYQRRPWRLVNDADPTIFDCDEVLVDLAASEILRMQRRGEQAMLYEQKAQQGLDRLKLSELANDRGGGRAVPHPGYAREYE